MLSEALRLLRVFHDLKQKDLAKALDMSVSHICEIEKGYATPSLDLLNKYADYFKIPLSSIVFFSEQFEQGKVRSDASLRVKRAIASKIINILKYIEDKTGGDHDQSAI